jgi:hypothetical protein
MTDTSDMDNALRTFCRGVLHAIGMFDPAAMTEEEKAQTDPARKAGDGGVKV